MATDESDRELDFWAPRRCFVEPISEIDHATDLISNAADSLLDNDPEYSAKLLFESDMPTIGDFIQRISGSPSLEVHRFREVPSSPPITDKRSKQRMPPRSVERSIFERDGWRCRFCGIRIVSRDAIRVLDAQFPTVVRWQQRRNIDKHAGLRAICSSLDHILPHSRGGSNDPKNLVAACGPCQFGRGYWTLDEVGFIDPRSRPPVLDSWDGLTRVCR